MNNPVPLEYVTSFAQTNQALMLQLATPLLTSGEHGGISTGSPKWRRSSRTTCSE
jgi:hypothetical protein